MAERSRDRSSSAESQPKFPGCSYFRRRKDNHFRCQQCRLNEGQTHCTQDRPCSVCKDWLPEAWATQAKASAQKTRRKAAKAAKKASEQETMDDSVEIHAPKEALQLPSQRASSDGSSKSKRTKTKATILDPLNRSPWLPTFLRWDSPAPSGRTATGRGVQNTREDTGTTNDRILRDTSRKGVTADGERASGPVQVPRAVPAPGDVPSPAVSPRCRTPLLRPLPLIIVIINHRAIEDPCHQPHLGHFATVGHRPVTTREDERAPIGPDRRTSPDGMCSCLPRSQSRLRRELSLWSLRRLGRFMLNRPQKFKSRHQWRTAQQVTTRLQATARPQVTARQQATARPQMTVQPQVTVRPQVTARPQVTVRPQLTTRPVMTRRMSW